jgi:hypothetical protein
MNEEISKAIKKVTDKKKADPFAWRNGGKRIELGDKEDGDLSAMINANGTLLCVMRHAVHTIRLADDIDPERTNPKITDTQQRVLSFGSDDAFVARTLLQAEELLKGGFMSKKVDTGKGVAAAWAFTKELASLHEAVVDLEGEVSKKDASFNGNPASDSSIRVPAISNIEQRTKLFVINADHAVRHIMELAQLFYPDIPSSKWILHLYEKLKKLHGEKHPATQFIQSIMPWVHTMRNTRNGVEHPEDNGKVTIHNYRVTEKGLVLRPTIQYEGTETNFPEMPVLTYMKNTEESLQAAFESTLACLCDINIDSALANELEIVEIPEETRRLTMKHVRYQLTFVREPQQPKF